MTEEEAKTKWCPFARTAFQFRAGDGNAMIVANRNEDDSVLSLCIGSACMAWRWGTHVETMRDVTTSADKRVEWTPESKMHGYCGLAGKP